MRIAPLAILAFLTSLATDLSAQLPAAVDLALVRGESAFVALRRDLHQHPELSGEESRTAGIVTRRLTELGIGHEHQEFRDGHMNVSYRYDTSLPMLAKALAG